MHELRLLGAKQPILSTNIELRRDGLPYANQAQPEDRGVAIYFLYKGKQHCFVCDDWKKVEDNIRAIEKTIEALRGIARWGTGDMMERAFMGFEALPAPIQWWQVLGFRSSSEVTVEALADRYKRLAMQLHPDRGGDESKMGRIELGTGQSAGASERRHSLTSSTQVLCWE